MLERVRIGTLSAPANTALPDIDDLVRRHALAKDPAGGRSTSHYLILD